MKKFKERIKKIVKSTITKFIVKWVYRASVIVLLILVLKKLVEVMLGLSVIFQYLQIMDQHLYMIFRAIVGMPM